MAHLTNNIFPSMLRSPATRQGMPAGHLQRTQREGIHVRHDVVPQLVSRTEKGGQDGRRIEIAKALRKDITVA